MTTHETIHELPEGERPYERLQCFGAEALSDAELLAIILRTGTGKQNALALAREILSKDSIHKGVTGLVYLSQEQLLEISGIGMVKASQIRALVELAKRIQVNPIYAGMIIHDSRELATYFMTQLKYMQQECVYGVFLDQKCAIIKWEMITKGTVNASLISPRELFYSALKYGAVHLVLLHNHPSGNVKPSKLDYEVTAQIVEAGKLLNILLLDHIIIGHNTYYSFMEEGKL